MHRTMHITLNPNPNKGNQSFYFRGQDVTAFLPCPDFLLVADCIYYEEVTACPIPLLKACLDQ